MVTLSDALMYLRPGITIGPGGSVEISDDGSGSGPIITRWDDLSVQPTQVELEATILPIKRAQTIVRIKALAGEKILARYPLTKQLNMVALASDLQHRRIVGSFTQTDEVIEAALQVAWVWIKAIRAYSDELEAKAMVNPDMDITLGWPE